MRKARAVARMAMAVAVAGTVAVGARTASHDAPSGAGAPARAVAGGATAVAVADPGAAPGPPPTVLALQQFPDALTAASLLAAPAEVTEAAVPAPLPPVQTAPAPEPPPVAAQDAPAVPSEPSPGSMSRAEEALTGSVPGPWLAAVPANIVLIPGSTSYGAIDGTIRVSDYHNNGAWQRLVYVMAHEWGHLASYAYGTGTYLGAPPAGYPNPDAGPERWADCVAQALTGLTYPGRGTCPAAELSWTADWLAHGP